MIKTDILIEGENVLGRYQVQILRHSHGDWGITIPPLNALLTNLRLILQPQTLRPHPPASIPGTYVTQIAEEHLGRYDCVVMQVKGGPRLHLLVGTRQREDFLIGLDVMMHPPLKLKVSLPLVHQDIERLVQFLSQMQ